jgi:hypothetical protein
MSEVPLKRIELGLLVRQSLGQIIDVALDLLLTVISDFFLFGAAFAVLLG